MICLKCMVQAYQKGKVGSGIAEDSRYTTWTLQECPSCGRLTLEHYTCVVVDSASEARERASQLDCSDGYTTSVAVVQEVEPRERARRFFEDVAALMQKKRAEETEATLRKICEQTGIPKGRLWNDVVAFTIYWSEKDPRGKKERWQLQKTFEVEKRLYTWLRRSKSLTVTATEGTKYVAGRV